jgi:molybdopterin molybdotransferase
MAEPPPLSVETARATILSKAQATRRVEHVVLADALGRTLAADLPAMLTLPPTDVSAMDGYAVRSADLALPSVRLKVVGVSAAGHGYPAAVRPGECVRIFTGAPVPNGADAVVLQEEVRAEDGVAIPTGRIEPACWIRRKGMDFAEGDRLLAAGARLGPLEIALAAAMNYAEVPVAQCPRVAILATGDELAPVGGQKNPNEITSSNSYAIAALVRAAGGEPLDLGIAGDSSSALVEGIGRAETSAADVLVTLGGASVGDRDLVKTALALKGMEIEFWRIAMRPGRPLIHGRLGSMPILGLPGNPVSAIVAGIVFLEPLVRALCGDPNAALLPSEPALLGAAVRGNDARKDFLRAKLTTCTTGLPIVTPFEQQDSSLLRVLATADCLLIREPHEPAASAGDPCRILRLPGRR